MHLLFYYCISFQYASVTLEILLNTGWQWEEEDPRGRGYIYIHLYTYIYVCVYIYIFIYLWTSLVAHMVKNLPARMRPWFDP